MTRRTKLSILVYLVLTFVNYGYIHGDLVHEFPYSDHQVMAMFFAAAPIAGSLIAAESKFRHWRLVPLSTEERWKHHQEAFPHLDREYFERHEN